MTRSLFLLLTLIAASPLAAQHRILMQGNDCLAIVEKDGKVSWEMKWGGIHDIHVLPNGHILVQQGGASVAEIDPENQEAKEWIGQITTIYGSLKKDPPKPGEEPKPLPFNKEITKESKK